MKSVLCSIPLFACSVLLNSASAANGPNPGGEDISVVSAIPSGGMIMWPGSIPPKGWLEANGQSTADYPRLAAIYGANLPDMRGLFPRAWDHSRGVDPNNPQLLQSVDDQIRSHSHTIQDPGHTHGSRYISNWSGSDFFGGDRTGGSAYWNTTASSQTGITVNSTGGAETAPKYMAWMYIIKK